MSGADTKAGSNFINRKNKGIAKPTIFPIQTTVHKDIPTVPATEIFPREMAAMVKAIRPMRNPSVAPTLNSRNKMCHHSLDFTSPVASARIMRGEDCDPVLPPDPVSMGIKYARAIIELKTPEYLFNIACDIVAAITRTTSHVRRR